MTPGGKGTRTGAIWEQVIKPVLEENYPGRYKSQINVGKQLFGGNYRADFLILDNQRGYIIVSAKWQQVSGTAQQKLIYDIASLIEIVRDSVEYCKAYIVLGGQGFTQSARQYLLNQRHTEIFEDGHLVEVVSLEDFLGRVNMKKL